MDNNNGGLSPTERQRKTAAEITRKKVLEAYEKQGHYESTTDSAAPNRPKDHINKEDWQKYHSAWQNYYQKYYGDYYRNAARNYIANEKLKAKRRTEEEDPAPIDPATELRQQIQSSNKPRRASKFWKKHHRRLIPIFAGVAVVLVFLFLQYNRLIFAPIAAYISPGNGAGATITALDSSTNINVVPDPKLIIPKLNVDVPVHFGISNDTETVNNAMNNGVAQFIIPGATAYPGQIGNLIITGHSAGDVYSNNQYKFIFSGLERLNVGDTIYINYESKRYTYSVVGSEIVEPDDLEALTKETNKPMLTLVTCTPLGTSRYRLLVHAEQINPPVDTATETANTTASTAHSESLPSNEDTFFEGIWNFLTGKQ